MLDLHGGNVYRYERMGKDNILDYSSNINPFGIPQMFIDSAKENFDVLTKYPDPDYLDLRNKIAEYNGVKPENVIVGNGATEILFLYIRALKPKKVLLLAPCFAEYKRALDSVQAEIEYFPLEEEEDFRLNTNRFIETMERNHYDLILLCNPNNPTGTLIDLETLERIKHCVEEKQVHLLMDEAFIEFVEKWTTKTGMLLQSKNIFVMRALTKFFAIPGLRLGYGLSYNLDVLQKLQTAKEPWSVNGFANLAGLTMLEDKEYIHKTEVWIQEEKEFMYQELCNISNMRAYKTETNFILLKLFTLHARDVQERMLEKGILIRDASNFKFLDHRFVRLAIKNRDSNIKVLRSLAEIIEERGEI